MAEDILYVCPECRTDDGLSFEGKAGSATCVCGWDGEDDELLEYIVDYERSE